MKLFVAVEDKCRYRLPYVIRGWKVSQLNNTDARYVLLYVCSEEGTWKKSGSDWLCMINLIEP